MGEPVSDIQCDTCKDDGWVCEDHPDKPWDEGDGCCGGAGMPCLVCNNQGLPRYPPGFSVIATRNGKMN